MSDQLNNADSMEDNSDWNTLDPIPLVHLLEDSTFEVREEVQEEEILSFSIEFSVAEDGRQFVTLIIEYRHRLTHTIYRIFHD